MRRQRTSFWGRRSHCGAARSATGKAIGRAGSAAPAAHQLQQRLPRQPSRHTKRKLQGTELLGRKGPRA
eukprot:3865177-Pyramimonas_sp.AAC.1